MTGRLKEVFIMGTQCYQTPKDSKSTGLITVQGIFDYGEGRLEGKLHSWLDDITCHTQEKNPIQ